jgi:hypothetical protein
MIPPNLVNFKMVFRLVPTDHCLADFRDFLEARSALYIA